MSGPATVVVVSITPADSVCAEIQQMKRIIIILIIVLGAGFAQAQKVKVNADPSVDLSRYKTYAWDKPLPPGNPIIQQTIIEAVEQAMATKGLVKVENEPDITVVFFAATD